MTRSAAALAEDLERHVRGDAIDARADSALYRDTTLLLRNPVACAAAALVACALPERRRTVAAKRVTNTIPIVIRSVADLVLLGLT